MSLQRVTSNPTGVMFWTQDTLECYHVVCQDDILYVDATGSILKHNKHKSQYLVYELVIRNPAVSAADTCFSSQIQPPITVISDERGQHRAFFDIKRPQSFERDMADDVAITCRKRC